MFLPPLSRPPFSLGHAGAAGLSTPPAHLVDATRLVDTLGDLIVFFLPGWELWR